MSQHHHLPAHWSLLLTLILDSCCPSPPASSSNSRHRNSAPTCFSSTSDIDNAYLTMPDRPGLTLPELLRWATVCRTWRTICVGHTVWKRMWEYLGFDFSTILPVNTYLRFYTYSSSSNSFRFQDSISPPITTPSTPRIQLAAPKTSKESKERCVEWYRMHVRLEDFARLLCEAAEDNESWQDEKGQYLGGWENESAWERVVYMPFRRLARSSRGVMEVKRLEEKLYVHFPATLKSLYSIENIATILHSLSPYLTSWRPTGSGLCLVPLRQIVLTPVPKQWAHLGTVLIKFLEGGSAGNGARGFAALEEGGDGELMYWYTFSHPTHPHPDPLVLTSTNEYFPSDFDDLHQNFIVPPSLSTDELHAVPEDLTLSYPSRLSDLIAWLVKESLGAAREVEGGRRSVARSVRGSVVGCMRI